MNKVLCNSNKNWCSLR